MFASAPLRMAATAGRVLAYTAGIQKWYGQRPSLTAKATNQIMCAGVIQAVAEAMAFAKSEDLPLDRLIETLGKGAGSSWYFVNRAPNILRDSYPAGFKVKLHEKDLKICRAMAARHGVQLPLIEMTLVHYRRLIEQGHGDEDISTLFRLKDALFANAQQTDSAPDGSR